MTDEVQFRCPTDASVHTRHGSSSSCKLSTQDTQQIQLSEAEQLSRESVPQVTREMYIERAQPPVLAPQN